MTFTFLNEGKKAETAYGNYTLGLFEISNEDYDTIVTCLQEVKNQIDELNDIIIDNFHYKIEKYIGGDLKMLAIMYGINAATSNCPCIWCTWDKRKLNDVDIENVDKEIRMEYSIFDKNKGARTIEESHISQKKQGYVNIPIFTSIPFQRQYKIADQIKIKICCLFYLLLYHRNH